MNTKLPLMLCADLRIADCDANQYSIEKKSLVLSGKNEGQETWHAIAYVGGIKSLPEIARRVIGDHFAAKARKKAITKFNDLLVGDLLANLPEKGKK